MASSSFLASVYQTVKSDNIAQNYRVQALASKNWVWSWLGYSSPVWLYGLVMYPVSSFISSYVNWECVCVCVHVCLTLCDPMDCSLPGSSIQGILQTRILEWAAILIYKASSRSRDQTWVSCTTGRVFTVWATREAHNENSERIK